MNLTVIIPTRNRHALALRAVESVLSNTYTANVVVVNNNDNPANDITPEIDEVFGHPGSSRVAVVRSESTPRNLWNNMRLGYELALQRRPRIVCFINDKSVFTPHAVHRIVHHDKNLLTWRIRRPNRICKDASRDMGKLRAVPYQDAWNYVNTYALDSDEFPHGWNMAFHPPLYAPWFAAACPDYTLGAQLLSYYGMSHHIDAPITFIPRAGMRDEHSIGRAVTRGYENPVAKEYIDSLVKAGWRMDNVKSTDPWAYVAEDFRRHCFSGYNSKLFSPTRAFARRAWYRIVDML